MRTSFDFDGFPSPARSLSSAFLRSVWLKSRDSSSKPGKPGIDGISAAAFARRLDDNIDRIRGDLKQKRFSFKRLRGVPIPKADSDKYRIICIPCVEDRLLQRAICESIHKRKALPIYNCSSFGFIPDLGLERALEAALRHRAGRPWVLKTDIEAFFDRIPRDFAKQMVLRKLRHHSFAPLICQAIDTEIHNKSARDEGLIHNCGIRRGVGIRQGMPLSPLLANLVLSDFDKRMENRGFIMVRYADYLAVFCHSKAEAVSAKDAIADELGQIGLTIPELSDSSKSIIIQDMDSLPFLGREIVYLGREQSYVIRIPVRQVRKICKKMEKDFSYLVVSQQDNTFLQAFEGLNSTICSYLGSYKRVHNYAHLEQELRACRKRVVRFLFAAVFGEEVINTLSNQKLQFLGIASAGELEPVDDIPF